MVDAPGPVIVVGADGAQIGERVPRRAARRAVVADARLPAVRARRLPVRVSRS